MVICICFLHSFLISIKFYFPKQMVCQLFACTLAVAGYVLTTVSYIYIIHAYASASDVSNTH